MSSWTVQPGDGLELTDLEGLDEASIRIVGGDVSVTAAEGPPRLEIGGIQTAPVEIRFENGVLSVWHEIQGIGRKGLLGIFGLTDTGPRVTVVLTAPPATRVEVATVSADVLLAGFEEPSRAKTVSGEITLKDLGERVEVKTVSGDVEAWGLRGDLRLGTVSGDLSMVDGTCKWLTAKSVSGDVTLDLDLVAGGNYSIASVSGDIALRIPNDPSLQIDVQTLSGDIDTPWGIEFPDDRPGKRRLKHTVGDGEAKLNVKTVSGDLEIVPKREAA